MTKAIKYPDIRTETNETYQNAEGLSRSALWTFKDLPYKYWYKYLSGNYVAEEKREYIIGSLVHTVFLEPEKFELEYHVIDQQTKPRKGTKPYDAMIEAAAGRVCVTLSDVYEAQSMVDALKQNEVASKLIKDTQIEKSIYWHHATTGLLNKCRPDIWKGCLVADVKTTDNASPEAFTYSAYKYGYYLQAGMIYEAMKALGQKLEKFIFLCVEKKPPYSTAVYVLDDAAMQYGIDLYHDLMDKFISAQQEEAWMDYGLQELSLPKWVKNENEGV